MRKLAILAAVLILPGAAVAEPVLKPQKRIGGGWIEGLSGWMSFVAFSPDGGLIASDAAAEPLDVSGNLSIWTFPGRRLVRTLPGRPDAISPDWRYYATHRSIARMSDGKPIISLAETAYANWAFSADGRYVVQSLSQGKSKSGLQVFDLPSGKLLKTLDGGAGQGMALARDGRLLAIGHWNLVALWDVPKGRLLAKLRGGGRYVSALAFGPKGGVLAVATDTGRVEVWKMGRSRPIWTLQLEGGDPSIPAFSPDGRWLAIGTYGTGTIWLIDARDGKVVAHAKVSDQGCGSAAFSPDGRYLITPSTGGLIKWPHDHGGTVRVFRVAGR